MTFAISYSRFSTGIQRKGSSLDRQQAAVEAYCKEHNLTLLDTFHDAGKSGYHGKHLEQGGQLRQLLDRLHSGDIPSGTHLLIEQTDRLTRQAVMEGLAVIQQLIAAGLVIVTLDDRQAYDHQTDFGKLVLLLARLQRGHDESKAKSERLGFVWSKKAQAMQQGVAPRMRLPFWLRREGEQLVVVEDQQRLIQRMFDLSISGHGSADVAKALNAEGITTSTGSTWNAGKVSKLLRSKAVIGWHQRKESKELFKIFPPVVSVDTFNKAQSALDSRTRYRGNSQKWSSALTGIAYCGNCGSRLKFTGPAKWRTGVCRAAVEGSVDCDNKRSMRYRSLVLVVVLAVRHEAAKLLMAPKSVSNDQRDQLLQELDTLTARVGRLSQAVALADDIPELVVQLNQANQERKTVKDKLSTLTPAEDASTAFESFCRAITEELPDMVEDVLAGDKATANRLNALLHSLPGFRVELNEGMASAGAVQAFQEDRLHIRVESPYEQGRITKSDEGTVHLGGDYWFLQQASS